MNTITIDMVKDLAARILENDETRNLSISEIYAGNSIRKNSKLEEFGTIGTLAERLIEDPDGIIGQQGIGLGSIAKLFETACEEEEEKELPTESETIPFVDEPVFTDEARQWHSAFIGKTGSGKTYAARGEAEDLLDLGRQVIIIDPTGAWPGLRCKPDGSPSGYDVAIFGGAYGDRPLTPDMAPALGRLAATTNRSMILDLSGISLELEDQREIVTQFLRNLYRLNRKPIHLFIDEADEFAPQELDKDTKEMRSLVARIMARGRSLGFRCTLITQRPAKIDKNSLSQIESMAVLRLTAPQDRKAVTDWFSDKGGPNQREILTSLGIFKTGEGCVFSGVDQTYSKRHFRLIKTYDTSSTPTDEQGNVRKVETGEIDLSDFDNVISYPEETSEEELEKAIARRRNLEEENRVLRARTLRAEARYEAMRRVFVQLRRVTEEIFIDDGLEAVEYADLLLMRNEVAKDNVDAMKIDFIDLNDVNGIPGDIEGIEHLGDITNPAADQNDSDETGELVMPDRILSALERNMIQETAKEPMDKESIAMICGVSVSAVDRASERLIAEKSFIHRDGKYRPTDLAFARQLSEKQVNMLRAKRDNPHDPLFDFNQKTITAAKRGGFIDANGKITERGLASLTLIEKSSGHQE